MGSAWLVLFAAELLLWLGVNISWPLVVRLHPFEEVSAVGGHPKTTVFDGFQGLGCHTQLLGVRFFCEPCDGVAKGGAGLECGCFQDSKGEKQEAKEDLEAPVPDRDSELEVWVTFR